ncbi:MAG: T9SS type A sorting domain-containing protein [Flavobacteriaceae bacterium]
MKKNLLYGAMLCAGAVFAQFNSDSPWIKELKENTSQEEMLQRNSNQPFTFREVQQAFNTYWETHDPTVKGSGYKPFKRWEFMVENEVDENGYLPTAQDIWNTYSAHNQMQANSNAAMADESNWSAIGPFTTVGTGSWSTGQARINVIMIDPNNAANGTDIWYAGAPAGGIWKSTDAGVTWAPMSDNLPQIGVSGIAVDHANSDIIYIATGDDDAGDTPSVGVFKSTDGGATWNQTGLNPSNSPSSMNDIYINPNDSNMLWVATNNGVYKSTNAGASWTQTLAGNIKDIKIKPNDPTTIYAVSSNRFYKSTDGGDSFSVIMSGLPFSSGRLVLDTTAANSNYVYIFREYNGAVSIYRSTDSGDNFTARTTSIANFSAGQAWYDLAMGVSSTNAEEVYVGCLNVWKSTNGGTSFTKLNNWNSPTSAAYTHADIHFLRDYNGVMYCGSDGGIYSSVDNGTSFSNHTFGIQASQFYRIAVAKTNVNKMVGGLQDNGGHAFNSSSSGQSRNYYGADGMDTAVDPTDENKFYGFIQNGGGPYISTDAGATLSSAVTEPESGNWVTPMAINSTGVLYGGYSSLYRLDGATWTELGALGGLCDLLEIAPSDDTIIYAVYNNRLKRSNDSGVSFTNVGPAFSSNIKGIGVHQTDPNTVWVTTSGGSKGIYKSTNANNGAGASFSNITGNLAATGEYFNDIVHQGDHTDNPVFIATSLGVYRLDDTSATWETFVTNLPNTIVNDLEINLADESITAATYGRGVWRSPIPIQMKANDVKLLAINAPVEAVVNCGDITPEITVKNNGLNTISEIDVTYTIDGTPLVYNWTGTLPSAAETTFALPVLNVTRGNHTMVVNTSVVGDANITNNESTIVFLANDAGTVNQLNTFETAADVLVTDHSIWERGVPTDALLNTASSGTQVYGTGLNTNHPDNVKAGLISQCYDLTQLSNPVLRFDMAFDLEENWDIAYVEYSLNQGNTWSVLGTINSLPLWYNSDRTNASSGASNDCQNCPGAQWTGEGEKAHASGGTNATMREYAYDFELNAANGETDLTGATNIIFKIVLHSDGSVNEEGIIVDDFIIDGTALSIEDLEENEFMVYPNPSSGEFKIRFNGQTSLLNVNVYDVTGKRVYQETIQQFTEEHRLNLEALSKGVYFLELENNQRLSTKKIMIK